MAYTGRLAVVSVPSIGLFGIPRDTPVDIDDSHVRAVLHRQGWEYVHEDDKHKKGSDE